jgi:hypothetical protein
MTGGHEMAGDHESVVGYGPGPGDVDLGRAAQVWRRHPGPAERAAGRLLRSPGLALALAAATLARSANVGVIVGVAGWVIVVLAGQSASGRLTAVITDSFLVLPYLGFAAVCAAIAWAATRIPRGTS